MNLSGVYGLAPFGLLEYGDIEFDAASVPSVVTPASRIFVVPANGRTMRAVGAKAPSEVLDFGIDWSGILNGDLVLGSIWSVSQPGVTITQSYTKNGTLNIAWFSGGIPNTFCNAVNTIATVGGRQESAAFKLEIVPQNYI